VLIREGAAAQVVVRTPPEFPQLTSPPYVCDPGAVLPGQKNRAASPPRVYGLPGRRLPRKCHGSTLLLAEPVLGVLFAERLLPLPPGAELAKDFFACYGREVSPTNAKNVARYCADATRSLGWTMRSGGKTYRTQPVVHPTAALLLLHHVYAPTPRSVELAQVLAEPVWKYLGFFQPDDVRMFFKNLERKWLIARYAHVDRLEQITTRYALSELLERKVRV